jgi:hypothetical protein
MTTIMTTNIAAQGASSAPSNQPPMQELSLIDIVNFCNQANLSNIQFQSASMEEMNNKMTKEQAFQDDCNAKTGDAKKRSETMDGINIAMTFVTIATLPIAIALSCAMGPEVLGADLLASSAIQSATTGVDVTSGLASLTLGTGLAGTQIQLGQDEQSIQIDTGAIKNGGDQVKQLSDTVTGIMKAGQSQGQVVGTCINNTSQADTAFKRKES